MDRAKKFAMIACVMGVLTSSDFVYACSEVLKANTGHLNQIITPARMRNTTSADEEVFFAKCFKKELETRLGQESSDALENAVDAEDLLLVLWGSKEWGG